MRGVPQRRDVRVELHQVGEEFPVVHDDEVPGLSVQSRRRVRAALDDLADLVVGDPLSIELPHTSAGFKGLEQFHGFLLGIR